MLLPTATTLHIGVKIKAIRKAKNMTQKQLSKQIPLSQSVISQIESGNTECPPDILRLIKTALDIENAPLLESERAIFERRLQYWCDEIRAKRFTNAHEMRNEMAIILKLPFEKDMAMRYMIFEAKLLILEGNNLGKAAEILNNAEAAISEASEEDRYHFYYAKGLLCLYNQDNKSALDYFIKAEELPYHDTEPSIYYYIALCYAKLGKPHHSIRLLEKASTMVDSERSRMLIDINITLATNFIHIKQYNKANTLLDKCLLDAACIKDTKLYGKTLHNFGYLYQHTNDYSKAIDYFNKAFEHYGETEWHYLENAYPMLYCQAMLNQFDPQDERYVKACTLAAESDLYRLLFESLPVIANLKYINADRLAEDIILRLIRMQKYIIALDYCHLLISTYRQRKNLTRVNIYKALSADIYVNMIY